MKHHNPHTPIMIREALDIQPRVWARYEFGREKVEDLSGRSPLSTDVLTHLRMQRQRGRDGVGERGERLAGRRTGNGVDMKGRTGKRANVCLCRAGREGHRR